MKQLLANWKTTSAGLAIIIGSVIHLVFAVIHHVADETAWTAGILAMVSGFGLIFAGDAGTSLSKAEASQTFATKAEVSTTETTTPKV